MFPMSPGRTLAGGCCPRVQLLATHPLEATLAGAPVLLHAVGAGATTAVCTSTPGPDPVLASRRTGDLHRAARRLWVSRVDVLDQAPAGALAGGLRAAVEAFAPDVLVVVAGPTSEHRRLLAAAVSLGVRVHLLGPPSPAVAGVRVPLSTTGHLWAWRRALAEHTTESTGETAVPLPGEGTRPEVVLTRVDGPQVLVHTRHESPGTLRLVRSTEARSA